MYYRQGPMCSQGPQVGPMCPQGPTSGPRGPMCSPNWESQPSGGSVRSLPTSDSQYSMTGVYTTQSTGGYDGLPVEELQGMGIGSHPGSTYGQVQDMDMGGHQGDMGHFDTDMPQPPQDNNQVAAWYDTDL